MTDVNLGVLAAKGSLYVQQPTLFAYIADRAGLEESAQDLFDVVLSGDVKPIIGGTMPMAQIAEAHKALGTRNNRFYCLDVPGPALRQQPNH